MPPTKRSALALAGRLRSMDDGRLTTLLRVREVRDSGIKDFFDLADRLLDRSSLQSTLSRLDRHALRALQTPGVDAPILDELALVIDGEPYDAVAEVLAGFASTMLDGAEPAALAPVSQVASEQTDHAAAERAFATTYAVLELVEELRRLPARELARGGIALPDTKRLAAATGLPLEQVADILAVASSAGLAVLSTGIWQPTPEVIDWEHRSTVERWLALTTSWIDTLPADLRTLLVERRHSAWGEQLEEWVRWLYPAAGDWMTQRIVAEEARATLLGVSAGGTPSTAGTHLLAGDPAAAAEAMRQHFPHEVDKVYVQHDLSIVSPGPLAAPLDRQLRQLADVENRGLATTYRVSAESLSRAVSLGATAESMRELLGEISLSGIPQPLDYLIDETSRRHALVRVGEDASGSYVRSDDTDLLTSIRVDQRLSSLSLRTEGEVLRSRLDKRIVFWALSDARYPVAVEDAAGSIVHLEREHPGGTASATRDHARELVERLRATAGEASDSGTAWLERQLELAIKSRIHVAVTITMPDGSTADYVLEPTGLGGGRLRARDRKADIERTLPLTSIVEVRTAD
jgi:hypothetical protein